MSSIDNIFTSKINVQQIFVGDKLSMFKWLFFRATFRVRVVRQIRWRPVGNLGCGQNAFDGCHYRRDRPRRSDNSFAMIDRVPIIRTAFRHRKSTIWIHYRLAFSSFHQDGLHDGTDDDNLHRIFSELTLITPQFFYEFGKILRVKNVSIVWRPYPSTYSRPTYGHMDRLME